VSGLLLRITFAIGVAGVLGSIAAGGVGEIVEDGRLPPLMRHPLDPARDALAAGDRGGFVEGHRMFVAIQARDARVYPKLANALVRSGDEAGAIEVLERALDLRPLPPIVHARLAVLYARHGRIAEARRQAQRALEEGEPLQLQLLRKLGLEAPGS
jgi:tetratricopeptide (TPR) repeat protein